MSPDPKTILFDTTIFIDYLYRDPTAQKHFSDVFSGVVDASVSIITDFELWCGIKSADQVRNYKALLSNFRRLQFNRTIARRAGELARPLIKAHDKSVSTQDLLIAATAEYYKTDLLTRNLKDFRKLSLKNIEIIGY